MKQKKSGIIINFTGMAGNAVQPNYICGADWNEALIWFACVVGSETPDYYLRVFGINPLPTLTESIIEIYKVRADK